MLTFVLTDVLIILMMHRFTRIPRLAYGMTLLFCLNIPTLSYAVLLSRVAAPFVCPRVRAGRLPKWVPKWVPNKVHIP